MVAHASRHMKLAGEQDAAASGEFRAGSRCLLEGNQVGLFFFRTGKERRSAG